jgi:hypothetical protein
LEAALQGADFGCTGHNACFDPPPDGGVWSGLELLLIFLLVAFIVWLIFALSKPSTPEKPLKERIRKHLADAEAEATNWQDQKAVGLIQRTRSKIEAEPT